MSSFMFCPDRSGAVDGEPPRLVSPKLLEATAKNETIRRAIDATSAKAPGAAASASGSRSPGSPTSTACPSEAMEEEIEEVSEELAATREKLWNTQDRLLDSEKETEELRTALEEARQEMEDRREESENMIGSNNLLKSQVSNLQASLDLMKRVFARTKEKSGQDAETIEMLEDTNNGLQAEVENLRDSIDLATSESMKLKNELVNRDRKLQQIRLEMRELEDKKDEAQTQLRAVLSEKTKTQRQMETLSFKVKDLKMQLTEATINSEDLQQSLESSIKDKEDLLDRLEASRVEKKESHTKFFELKKVLNLSTETLETLKVKFQAKDEEIMHLKRSEAEREESEDQLKSALEAMKVDLQEAQEAQEKSEKTIMAMQKELISVVEKSSEERTLAQNKDKEVDELKKKLDELSKSKVALRDQVHTYSQEIRRLETENSSLQQSLATQVAELNEVKDSQSVSFLDRFGCGSATVH